MDKISKTQVLEFCLLLGVLLLSRTSISAQNTRFNFDEKTLHFAGTLVEQARCLLRPNKIGGVLGEPLKKLAKPFEKLIGPKVERLYETLS